MINLYIFYVDIKQEVTCFHKHTQHKFQMIRTYLAWTTYSRWSIVDKFFKAVDAIKVYKLIIDTLHQIKSSFPPTY